MTSEQFVGWLEGYLEDKINITPEQLALIKFKLSTTLSRYAPTSGETINTPYIQPNPWTNPPFTYTTNTGDPSPDQVPTTTCCGGVDEFCKCNEHE